MGCHAGVGVTLEVCVPVLELCVDSRWRAGRWGGVDPPAGLGWAGGWPCPECPLIPTEVLDMRPVEAEKNLRTLG